MTNYDLFTGVVVCASCVIVVIGIAASEICKQLMSIGIKLDALGEIAIQYDKEEDFLPEKGSK